VKEDCVAGGQGSKRKRERAEGKLPGLREPFSGRMSSGQMRARLGTGRRAFVEQWAT